MKPSSRPPSSATRTATSGESLASESATARRSAARVSSGERCAAARRRDARHEREDRVAIGGGGDA
jgi:hypothetical protein